MVDISPYYFPDLLHVFVIQFGAWWPVCELAHWFATIWLDWRFVLFFLDFRWAGRSLVCFFFWFEVFSFPFKML